MEEIKVLKRLEHRVDTWPEQMKDIAEMIGIEGAVALARKYGGQEVYFPERLPPNHHLVQTLGRTAAERLCQKYTRERVRITSNRVYLRWFDARVYALQGLSIREVARVMKLTRNHAQELLAGFNVDEYEPIEATPAAQRCPGCGRRLAVHRHAPPHGGPAISCLQLDFGFPAA